MDNLNDPRRGFTICFINKLKEKLADFSNEFPSTKRTAEIEKNSLPLLHQTFFKTQREKGYPYFASTRVGSCKYIKIKNGKSLAIPFYIINSKGLTLNHFKKIPKKLYTSKL